MRARATSCLLVCALLAVGVAAACGGPHEPVTAEGAMGDAALPPCPRTVVTAYDPQHPPAKAETPDAGAAAEVIAAAGGTASAPKPAASTSASASPSKLALKPKTPWKPVARPASIDPNCGGRDNPCPLQRWMRFNMAPALAAKNAAALAAALDRSAGFAPGGNGDWQNIAKTAAAAARAGDIEEARKSCRACHGAFKAMWREKYRLTPIN
jgi:hypothetical protein